jgi:hypothetical protein
MTHVGRVLECKFDPKEKPISNAIDLFALFVSYDDVDLLSKYSMSDMSPNTIQQYFTKHLNWPVMGLVVNGRGKHSQFEAAALKNLRDHMWSYCKQLKLLTLDQAVRSCDASTSAGGCWTFYGIQSKGPLVTHGAYSMHFREYLSMLEQYIDEGRNKVCPLMFPYTVSRKDEIREIESKYEDGVEVKKLKDTRPFQAQDIVVHVFEKMFAFDFEQRIHKYATLLRNGFNNGYSTDYGGWHFMGVALSGFKHVYSFDASKKDMNTDKQRLTDFIMFIRRYHKQSSFVDNLTLFLRQNCVDRLIRIGSQVFHWDFTNASGRFLTSSQNTFDCVVAIESYVITVYGESALFDEQKYRFFVNGDNFIFATNQESYSAQHMVDWFRDFAFPIKIVSTREKLEYNSHYFGLWDEVTPPVFVPVPVDDEKRIAKVRITRDPAKISNPVLKYYELSGALKAGFWAPRVREHLNELLDEMETMFPFLTTSRQTAAVRKSDQELAEMALPRKGARRIANGVALNYIPRLNDALQAYHGEESNKNREEDDQAFQECAGSKAVALSSSA